MEQISVGRHILVGFLIGAVIGIALAKGGKGVNYKILRRISIGWVATPILAALICFVSLFIMQNVFEQEVIKSKNNELSIDRFDTQINENNKLSNY